MSAPAGIEIRAYIGDVGVTYLAKGAHPPEDFAAAVLDQFSETVDPCHVQLGCFRHIPTPKGDDYDFRLHPATQGRRGAFIATWCEP